MVKRTIQSAPAINLRDYEKESAFIWAINNIKLPKGAKWDFTHRKWQVDIFDDQSLSQVTIKSTQMGLTTLSICKALHFAAYHKSRIMYTLPRQDDVTDLVTSRIMEMIQESPALATLMSGIDNVRMKKFGESYIHFMESSVTPRMLDVDYLVNDEVDMSDQDNLDQYIARLDASVYKIHLKLSTPTIHDFGIDKEYKLSDQKAWLVKCPRCNHYQELNWDKNVRHVDNATWYACEMCDRTLDVETIQNGSWVARFPGRESSGYAISQMMSTYIDPHTLWTQSKTMKQKNFVNLRLGKAYSASTGNISRSTILEKCFVSGHEKQETGDGYYMGVDQGHDLHVAIGRRKDDVMHIVKLMVVDFDDGFDFLIELIRKYKIRQVVLDKLPNEHASYKVAREFKGNRIALAIYNQSAPEVYREEKSENKVVINKHNSFDNLVDQIEAGHIQFYGTRSMMDKSVSDAVNHLSNMRRDEIEQTTKMGGTVIRNIWTNVGPDHYADAINYLIIAGDMRKGGSLIIREIGGSNNDSIDDDGILQKRGNIDVIRRRSFF